MKNISKLSKIVGYILIITSVIKWTSMKVLQSPCLSDIELGFYSGVVGIILLLVSDFLSNK